MMRSFSALAGLLGLLSVLLGCQDQPPPGPKVEQQEIFTTVITLSFYDNPGEAVYTSIFDRLHQIDGWMSDYKSDSEISRVSAQAGLGSVAVSPETLHVIQTALSESALTNGIFDPTIGPVTHLWNVGSDTPRVPSSEAIAAARTLVNWKDVVVDEKKGTLFLKRKGMQLDVGGVAKGFAMDEALAIARKAGVTSGIFNMGNSSIGLLGKKPGGKPWKIGIQDPFQATGAYFATVEGFEMTVETSGPYQKFFMSGGKRYHHIMDPRTGSPAASGLEQVTLLLPLDTKLADGLSTSCFILGLDKGMALIESLPDAAAVFVTSDRRVVLSSRVGTKFTLLDKTFTLVPVRPGS
jgi:thiamine biosynthesis lipoprotein